MQSVLLNTGASDAVKVLWHLILLSSTIQVLCCFCNQIGKWHPYTCGHYHFICQQHSPRSCAQCRRSGHPSNSSHTADFPVSETVRLNRSYSRLCRLKMWWCVLGVVGKVLKECMTMYITALGTFPSVQSLILKQLIWSTVCKVAVAIATCSMNVLWDQCPPLWLLIPQMKMTCDSSTYICMYICDHLRPLGVGLKWSQYCGPPVTVYTAIGDGKSRPH